MYSVPPLLPNPNPLGHTITIEPTETVSNAVSFENYGSIDNNGILTNSSSLTNDSAGAIDNSGTLANASSGTIYNNGTLMNTISTTDYGTIENYGTIQNDGTVYNHGALHNLGRVINNGTYTQTAGVTFNNGMMSQTSIRIQGGLLSGAGVINGTETVDLGAGVKPGSSPGTLTINSAFTSGGNLLIDIAGPDPRQFGVLAINGDAVFTGGTVRFDFLDGYLPGEGSNWDFLQFDTITGWELLSFTVEGLGGEYTWKTQLSPDHATLLITDAPEMIIAPLFTDAPGALGLNTGGPAAPLPGTLLLFGAGLGVLALYHRRRPAG